MRYLAAIALLFVLSSRAESQTTFGWNGYQAQQQTFYLQQIASELSWMNHRQQLYGGYRTNYYRPVYRRTYYRPYNYDPYRALFGNQFRTGGW